uniref:Uncharacterized protein n=1 Tax=viral metagenome TaxID=1070528 RepID=A0A6M3LXA3_9ZZZZ
MTKSKVITIFADVKISQMQQDTATSKVYVNFVERKELISIVVNRLKVLLGTERAVDVCNNALSYNVITPQLLSEVTGLPYRTILSKTTLNRISDSELKICYPFASIKGKGPKFIVFDENCESLVRSQYEL